MEIRKSVCLCVMVIMLIAIPAGADVILTPTEDTWLYGSAHSLQGGNTGSYYGNPDPTESEWNITPGPLNNPSVSVEDDPISSADDGLLLDGLSSFAIAESTLTDLGGWSNPDSSDTFILFVNNQATQDPGSENPDNPYGPEGWGQSVSYLFVTYDTSPGDNANIGDPMTVTLNLNVSEQLHVSGWGDEYLLEIGYSLGTNLTDEEFDVYAYWSSQEQDERPVTEEVVFSDSLVYSCNVGDPVEMLIVMASFSYSHHGYAWTEATLDPITGNTISGGAQSMVLKAVQNESQDSTPLTSLRVTITAATLTPPGGNTIFGPRTYLRNILEPDQYSDTFSGTEGKAKLIIKNGNEDGTHRISSAIIIINGEVILKPDYFNQNVYDMEIPVNLNDGDNAISVKLRSKPGSYFAVEVVQ